MVSRDDAEPTLFSRASEAGRLGKAEKPPLAERMRPRDLTEVCGQKHLLAPGRWLRRAIEEDRVPSLVFWGPPGVGKTTLARVIAERTRRKFVPFSAVLGGVPELRLILKQATDDRRLAGKATVLFVDEIHRFNKAQQDAFLPHVERGIVTLIGATTENPSFSVNAAVLSRARVARLEGLSEQDLVELLGRALGDSDQGLGDAGVQAEPPALLAIARAARGDARQALSLLDSAVQLHASEQQSSDSSQLAPLTAQGLSQLIEDKNLLYDKAGDEHYNVVSAWIKSMRGSDPDASIYWLMRMIEAGEDPRFLARRLMIFASEDVGCADPRALPLAVAAQQAFLAMGLPEGIYPLAHACIYLACCPKSGAVGQAWHGARDRVREQGALPVPHKLRNAPTQLMKDEGYGQGYQYAHNYAQGFVPGESYLPDELLGQRFYQPTQHGLEKAIGERLERIFSARKGSVPGSSGGQQS